MEEGVCVQIVGDWNLVPQMLRPLMAKAMVLTRYNTRAKLNVAFAYTGRNEITRGIQCLEEGVLEGDIRLEDLNEDLLEKSFQILPSLPVDLIVRTSGETRLSDFLLWQVKLSFKKSINSDFNLHFFNFEIPECREYPSFHKSPLARVYLLASTRSHFPVSNQPLFNTQSRLH